MSFHHARLWIWWPCPSPAPQQVTTPPTYLSSNLQVAQSSIAEPVPSGCLNGMRNYSLGTDLSSFIPWPFIKFWKEKVKILKSSYRRIMSPPHASVSPLCVRCEYFTPEHSMDRTVTKCTALSSPHVTNTSLHILLYLPSALIEIQDEVKWSTHRHSLPSLQSPSELKCDKSNSLLLTETGQDSEAVFVWMMMPLTTGRENGWGGISLFPPN